MLASGVEASKLGSETLPGLRAAAGVVGRNRVPSSVPEAVAPLSIGNDANGSRKPGS